MIRNPLWSLQLRDSPGFTPDSLLIPFVTSGTKSDANVVKNGNFELAVLKIIPGFMYERFSGLLLNLQQDTRFPGIDMSYLLILSINADTSGLL